MKIGGISIILLAGLCLLCMVTFQVLTGRGIVKGKMKAHRTVGYVILALALVHGMLAILTG